MRNNSGTKFESDIVLGEKYRDNQTGIEGTAVGVHFYQFGCERVSLESVNKGEIKEYGFDAPRLTHIETGVTAKTTKTGGPAKHLPTRSTGR